MWNLMLCKVFPAVCILLDGICVGLRYGISVRTAICGILCYAAGSVIQMALHECGHLLGGICSGYELVFLQVGPVRLVSSEKGKLSFCIQQDQSGQCVMVPRSLRKIRYWWYNFGGILFNLLMCTGAAVFCRPVSDAAGFFLLQLFFAGLPKLYTNCIPCLLKGYPNDGYILRLLTREPVCRRDYGTYLYVYARCFRGLPVSRQAYGYERTAEEIKADRIYYDALQELLEEAEEEREC